MTQPGPEDGARPEIKKTKSNLVEIATYSILAALLGAVLTFFFLRDGEDPDRPPIIVRNGSVILEEENNSTPGRLVPYTSKQIWHHDHSRRGTWKVDVDLIGLRTDVGDCSGSAGFYFSKVTTTDITYTHTIDGVSTERHVLVEMAQPGPHVERLLQFTLDANAQTYQDPKQLTRLEVEKGANVTTSLLKVTVTSKNQSPKTCYFDSAASPAPEVRLNQGR